MPGDPAEPDTGNGTPAHPVVDIAVPDPRWATVVGDDADARLAPVLDALFSLAPGPKAAATASVVLADDRLVASLNRDYRGRDRPTNVLSFPFSDDAAFDGTGAPPVLADPPLPACLGDVYVAFETATAEADRDGKTRFDHLCHLIIHGMLHLLGFDHQDGPEADVMESLERRVLDRLGVADPYAAPSDDEDRIDDEPGLPAPMPTT